MRTIQTLLVSAALAIAMAAPASAAQSDPEVIIYRFPGVRDEGGANNAGAATVFHCTNFSGAAENIRFVTRDFNTNLKSNVVQFIPHLGTRTGVTHFVNSYSADFNLATGDVRQGTTAIAATSCPPLVSVPHRRP